MNLIFFDQGSLHQRLLPLTYTRPASKMLVGLLSIEQKWVKRIPEASISYLTQTFLQKYFQLVIADDNYLINGGCCPDEEVLDEVKSLAPNELIVKNGSILAARLDKQQLEIFMAEGKVGDNVKTKNPQASWVTINRPWHIFQHNGDQIKLDFALITKNRTSNVIDDSNSIVYNQSHIFLEEGASVKAVVLNAEAGPIYLAKGSQVQEGSIIRGPFGLLENATINMGAKIRENTTIGPYCKVGGEVNNAVIFGYSNKGHEGFLGNSVLGEWCNLGADTNNSNLKNNYSSVRLWNYEDKQFEDTGLQFCGLIMGDHSKCSINTMFNTGTVVGIASNIFGTGFPPKYVPSFTWGGIHGNDTYRLEKAMDVAEKVMQRRGKSLTDEDKKILSHIFEITKELRSSNV